MEEYKDFKDYLCLSRDKDIINLIRKEELFFSDSVKAFYFRTQDRNILITSKALYRLDEKSRSIFNITFNFRIETKN